MLNFFSFVGKCQKKNEKLCRLNSVPFIATENALKLPFWFLFQKSWMCLTVKENRTSAKILKTVPGI